MRRSTVIAFKLVVCAYAAFAGDLQVVEHHNSKGNELFHQAKYAESEVEYRKALEAQKPMGQAGIHIYAAALNNLASAVQHQGRTAEARQAFEETVRLDKQLGQYRDPILAHALNNLALMHHVEAELPKAAKLLERALQVTMREDSTRAGTLHNLAAVYMDQRRYAKAEELFTESLRMNRAAGATGPAPPTLTYLARLAALRGDITRAESLMREALEIRRKDAPDHPVLAVTIGDIGELQKDTKRYPEAVASFKQALEILDAKLGKDHLFSAPILFQYGETLRLQGRYEQAIPFLERSRGILEQAFGPDHVRLITVYQTLAKCHAKLKRKQDAKKYERRARVVADNRVDYSKHTVDANAFLPLK